MVGLGGVDGDDPRLAQLRDIAYLLAGDGDAGGRGERGLPGRFESFARGRFDGLGERDVVRFVDLEGLARGKLEGAVIDPDRGARDLGRDLDRAGRRERELAFLALDRLSLTASHGLV